MRYLYTVLYFLLTPIALLRWVIKSRHNPAYRQRLGERFGLFDVRPTKPVIWLHAVSVGETLAALPLIKRLQEKYPDYQIAVTTTTPTGSEQVKAKLGDSVLHVYTPIDQPGAVNRFLDRINPSMLLIMETELWPNLIHYSAKRGVKIVLVNARMSQKSANAYLKFRGMSKKMMGDLSLVLAHAKADGDRFLAMGLTLKKLVVTGSLKFDLELSDVVHERASRFRDWLQTDHRPVMLVASTHEGEEEQLLQAYATIKAQHRNLLMVLAPRHPERAIRVIQLCRDEGWNSELRSHEKLQSDTDILVGDTLGELLSLCGAATVTVVGGSFIEHGGHNPIEPAAFGCPTLIGPSFHNFMTIVKDMQAEQAIEVVQNPAMLATRVSQLLDDKKGRDALGKAAQQYAEANRGALTRVVKALSKLTLN